MVPDCYHQVIVVWHLLFDSMLKGLGMLERSQPSYLYMISSQAWDYTPAKHLTHIFALQFCNTEFWMFSDQNKLGMYIDKHLSEIELSHWLWIWRSFFVQPTDLFSISLEFKIIRLSLIEIFRLFSRIVGWGDEIDCECEASFKPSNSWAELHLAGGWGSPRQIKWLAFLACSHGSQTQTS